ncbi:MAG: CBS domain-containing protein [Nannocystaceae bacterium]
MQPRTILIRDVMTPAPVSIPHDFSLADAADRMFEHKIRHLPVLEGGHLVGLVSERDVAVLSSIPSVDRAKIRVEQAMSSQPRTCSPGDALTDVVRVMVDHKQGSAVVMENGDLVGIVTTIDALALLLNYLERA